MHTSSRSCLLAMAIVAVGFTGSLSVTAATPPSANGLGISSPTTAAPDASAPTIVLEPVRANVSLTTNALIGFVNSQPIFVQDLFRPIDKELRSLAAGAKNIGEFRDAARNVVNRQIQTYISQLVMNSAATAALSDQERTQLDIYLRIKRSEMLSSYGGSEALANAALKATGSSVDKEIEDQRRDLVVRMYMHKQLAPKIVITRAMVMDEYDRSAAKHVDAEIELFTITLPLTRWLHEAGTDGKRGPLITNPSPEQLRAAQQQMMATAQEISDKARHGADFATLAEDYSSADRRANYGGYWPKVTHDGSLNPKIENYAFSLPANTVGDPLPLPNDDYQKSAVVIIKVGQKKEARVIPFSEAQKGIMQTLTERQYQTLSAEYMQKLSQGAAVEAVERMINVALEAAITRYATQ